MRSHSPEHLSRFQCSSSPIGKRTMVERNFTLDYEILYASEFDTRPHFVPPICTLS